MLLNGAGRIEDVQTAVEAPIATALSSTEKEVLAAVDPEDFGNDGHTASGMSAANTQSSASKSASSARSSPSQATTSQKAAPLTSSSKEQTSFMQQVLAPLATIAKRVAVYGSFVLTKQPSRVKQVLQQVCVLVCRLAHLHLLGSPLLLQVFAYVCQIHIWLRVCQHRSI